MHCSMSSPLTSRLLLLSQNPDHVEMSASFYAFTAAKGCAVDMLDVAILGNSGRHGLQRQRQHRVGWHPAAWYRRSYGYCCRCKITVIVTPLLRGMPMVVDHVITHDSGNTVDVVVTERGTVNPARPDLLENLRGKGLRLMDIHDLKRWPKI